MLYIFVLGMLRANQGETTRNNSARDGWDLPSVAHLSEGLAV
jgi:hypothetical protein